MLDKHQIQEQIINQLQADRDMLERAAKATHQGATHEESSAEHRYDTRGLEASYLAGAQAKRAQEIEKAYLSYKSLLLREFAPGEAIALSALIQLEGEAGPQWYFLGPQSGGMKIEIDQTQITLVTPLSPLGERLLGGREGDILEVEKPGGTIEYEIIRVQ